MIFAITSIPLKEVIDITVNLLFKHNPGLNLAQAELKNFSNLQHQVHIFFFKVHFLTK